MRTASTPAPAIAPLGVIETISAGLAVVKNYPALLLLPILLDLFLWVTPPLVMGDQLIAEAVSPLAQAVPLAPEGASEVPPLHETLDAQLSQINLWGVGLSPFLFWPTLMAGRPLEAFPTQARIPVGQWTRLGLIIVVGIAVGVWINMLWLNHVARRVAPEGRAGERRLFDAVGRQWLRVLLLGLLLFALFMMTLLPLSFVMALLTLLLPGLGELLTSLLVMGSLWAVLWLSVYLYFTVAALVMEDAGVVRAPWASLNLIRRYFWSALGFILLSLILNAGFQLIWLRLDGSLWGRGIGILGNATLGTALVAAMFIFFKERYPHLASLPAQKQVQP